MNEEIGIFSVLSEQKYLLIVYVCPNNSPKTRTEKLQNNSVKKKRIRN